MNNSVRNTLRVLAALLLASVLGITILLIIGTDRSPLPDRESLAAHLDSPAVDHDAFPLWVELFHNQEHDIDSDISRMLRQTAHWDDNVVERNIIAFESSLTLLRRLRKFDQMRSDYSTDPIHSSPFSIISITQLAIAAGVTRWHQLRHDEAIEFFLDAAHVARLTHHDAEANLASLATAKVITLTLVSALQRPVAEATTQTEVSLLKRAISELSEISDENHLRVFGNETIASKIWLMSTMETPLIARLETAIDSYRSLHEYCLDSQSMESYCRNLGYVFLTTAFPRFYVHWPSLTASAERYSEDITGMIRLSCSETSSEAMGSENSIEWRDYLTPGSLSHYPDSLDEHIRRALIDRCLVNFFTRSQKAALFLKAHEIKHGTTASELDQAMPDIPEDPFGAGRIHYDDTKKTLWSVGLDHDTDTTEDQADISPPLAYASYDVILGKPTYSLDPESIPEQEMRKSRCEQDPDIAPLEPLEEPTEDEQAEAI